MASDNASSTLSDLPQLKKIFDKYDKDGNGKMYALLRPLELDRRFLLTSMQPLRMGCP